MLSKMNERGIDGTTERLTLRAWTMDDLEAEYAIYSDPEVCKGISMQPCSSLDAAREGLTRLIERHAGYGPIMGVWAIEITATKQVIGTLLLKPLPETQKIEIGWHLARAHWGHGYATEAALWAQARAFNELQLDILYSVAFPWNEKSTNVMDRLGMERIGLTSEFYDEELMLYTQTKEQYRAKMQA